MSLLALGQGSLARDPDVKVDKRGKNYLSFNVKVIDGTITTFVNVLVFSESAMAELAGLKDGDGVSVSGRLQCSLWKKDDGEPQIGVRIIANRVLPLKKEPKARRDDSTSDRREPAPAKSTARPPFDDQIPF